MHFLAAVALSMVVNAATLTNVLTIRGEMPDRTPLNGSRGGANVNRLGGFGSDLFYERAANVFYGLMDRGPGGGTIGFDTRVQKFTLAIDRTTGAATNFRLQATIRFTLPSKKALNGIDPSLEPGGRSFDPEGFVVGRNGHFFVSDEYGPSIYEFLPNGVFVREFTPPENVLPRDGKGRQLNRGFEGLAISPDGNRLFALLQAPLADEGSNAGCTGMCTPQGRFSRNARLIEYSVSSGRSVAQYIYQVESLTTINARVPDKAFEARDQGYNIVLSALTAISDREFLVVERDNRGFGIDDPTSSSPVSTKRVYRIDITRATNVNRLSLAGTNTLPANVIPAEKTLFLDVLAELQRLGSTVPEKIEGLTIGPRLADGTYALLMASDNDFSVTQNESGAQFDVCTNGQASRQVAIDAGCPAGMTLIPSFLMSFKTAAGFSR